MKVAGLQLFGPAHLWTLTLIAIVGSIIVLTVRLAGNPAVARSVAFSLAALLVVNAAITYGTRLATDRFDVSTWLPMHLCDWATIAVVLALCFRWQWSYELAYFWSLGGTLQALLTPDIVADCHAEVRQLQKSRKERDHANAGAVTILVENTQIAEKGGRHPCW